MVTSPPPFPSHSPQLICYCHFFIHLKPASTSSAAFGWFVFVCGEERAIFSYSSSLPLRVHLWGWGYATSNWIQTQLNFCTRHLEKIVGRL